MVAFQLNSRLGIISPGLTLLPVLKPMDPRGIPISPGCPFNDFNGAARQLRHLAPLQNAGTEVPQLLEERRTSAWTLLKAREKWPIMSFW